jgi:hypothetical protein
MIASTVRATEDHSLGILVVLLCPSGVINQDYRFGFLATIQHNSNFPGGGATSALPGAH